MSLLQGVCSASSNGCVGEIVRGTEWRAWGRPIPYTLRHCSGWGGRNANGTGICARGRQRVDTWRSCSGWRWRDTSGTAIHTLRRRGADIWGSRNWWGRTDASGIATCAGWRLHLDTSRSSSGPFATDALIMQMISKIFPTPVLASGSGSIQ